MGRKPKFPPEIKIDCVERILQGKASRHSMAKELGAHKKTIQEWIAKYRADGPSGLLDGRICRAEQRRRTTYI